MNSLHGSGFIRPLKRQREVLYLPVTGHSVVQGVAGSGKTTMALLRAQFMTEPGLEHSGRTLILTYNKSLCSSIEGYIRQQGLSVPGRHGVTAANYHRLIVADLCRLKGKRSFKYPSAKDGDELISKAVAEVMAENSEVSLFRRPLEFFKDEIEWILRMGISSVDEYVEAERIGRGRHVLLRAQRPYMYQVMENYLKLLRKSGFDYDWNLVVVDWCRELEAGKISFPYRHVIIDEGQDLPLCLIRALGSACGGLGITEAVSYEDGDVKIDADDDSYDLDDSDPADSTDADSNSPDSAQSNKKPGSLTFFVDEAQQIYGPRISWKKAGLNIKKVWRLTENYRNTAEIFNLARTLAESYEDEDSSDKNLSDSSTPHGHGQKPFLYKCSSIDSRMNMLRDITDRFNTRKQRIGILVSTHKQMYEVKNSIFGSQTIANGGNDKMTPDNPGIYVSTIHSAKGLEFDVVVLPYMDAGFFSDPHTVTEDDKYAFSRMIKEYKTLYVAVTRAREELHIMFVDNLTAMMPDDQSLYQEGSV